MIIYFVRHGQTEDNIRGIIQGQLDTPLNDTGRAQARLLANRLKDIKFDEAWSSSLSRARETAEIVLQQHPGLALRTDPGLMERGLGSLEGRQWQKGEKLPDDVEASDVFRTRITTWFTTFLSSQSPELHFEEQPKSSPSQPYETDRTVLVTSHGAYLTTLLSILLHLPFSFITPDDLDPNASCINTSIMKVHVRSRADVAKADDAQGNNWRLYADSLRRLESQEMKTILKVGEKGQSEWVGMIQSWADARHLDDQDKGDSVGVVDDMGDTEKR